MNKMQSLFVGLFVLASASGFSQGQPQNPPPGPAAQLGKTVVFIASDYKNGGVMGVFRGFEEATQELGWKIRVEDGEGKKTTQATLLSNVIASRPHGVVFGGFDPSDFVEEVAAAKRNKIILVGWHAANDAGPTKDLFVNVSTRPIDVAKIAVDFVIKDAASNKRPVGVIVFNDNQYAVANAKTAAIKKAVSDCVGYTGCKVLSVENVLISEAVSAIPAIVPKLISTHGTAWTYSLAINDVYFDAINYPLVEAKRTDIINVSAGDGSNKALSRIGSGISQQMATVAEPLKMQGYQLADELNRAFSGAPPSGFQSEPILVTAELLKMTGSRGIEATSGFEAAFRDIWTKK